MIYQYLHLFHKFHKINSLIIDMLKIYSVFSNKKINLI